MAWPRKPWSLLREFSPQDREAQAERASIIRKWHDEDRHFLPRRQGESGSLPVNRGECARRPVKSYQDFLRARRIHEARLACSRAIATIRSVAIAPHNLANWLEDIKDLRRLALTLGPDDCWGGWGPDALWGGVHDPLWDGVTLVAKTPGKHRRQRANRRERRAQIARDRAEIEARAADFPRLTRLFLEEQAAASERMGNKPLERDPDVHMAWWK
ncbi:hypothetical protein DFH06DRAFT_1323326 [Mycena polygramma]|nr:hypothetical protein DFH06DRAFT_1323326 [Mycena polygramma]